ncbi:hypothetical protein KAH37_06370 [bacterium]|nr:hypothetical protein [bacterium]
MIKTLVSLLTFLMLFSCSYTVKDNVPPEDIVERVTDMHLLLDGNHLLILNSNFDRSYDYGRLSVVRLATKDKESEVVSSILVESLSGKIAVTKDEKFVFVTTRAFGTLHKIKISYKDGVPLLSYAIDDSLDASSLTLSLEPYAMVFSEDEKLLYVTHLMNGELIVVDVATFKVLHTFKLLHGVSDIMHDPVTHANVVTYRDWAELSAVLPSGSVSAPGIDIFRLIPDMPDRGVDMRDLAASTINDSVFYATYRNTDAKGEEWPLVVRFSLLSDGVRIHGQTDWLSPVTGRLGEIEQVSDMKSGDEWLLVAAVNEEVVYVLEGLSGNLLWRLEADDCHPYQLHSSQNGGVWRLFVSCFSDNKILVYDVDSQSDTLFHQIEVIK